MATNYSDLYTGLINQNLSTNAKKAYQGPEVVRAGETVQVRAYFNLADYATEAGDVYTVRICEVPYLGAIVINKISAATTFVEPDGAVDGRFFCSDDGVNGNTDYLAPTINDGGEVGPFREIKCRCRNGALFYTATYASATVADRLTPVTIEATIRHASGRGALVEVSQTAVPIS